LEIVDSSPLFSRRTSPNNVADESIEFVDSPERPKPSRGFDYLDNVDLSSPLFPKKATKRSVSISPADESIEFVEGPSRILAKGQNRGMPPPPLPARFTSAAALIDDLPPEPSFAIRPVGKKRTRILPDDDEESPIVSRRSRLRKRKEQTDESPAVARPSRLHKRKDKESAGANPKKDRSHRLPAMENPLYDFEAAHSGDEISEGSSGEDEEESDSDRRFLEELPETQVSPSYNQTLAYRQSLLTQAPGAPVFANKPSRNLRGYRMDTRMSNRRRPGVSSSPPIESDTPDEYALGSFVVDDEAEISYEV